MENQQQQQQKQKRIVFLAPKVEAPRASLEDSMTLANFSRIVRRSSSPTTRSTKVSYDQDNSSTSYKRKIPSLDSDKAKSCALERAEEVQANLDSAFPSCVKSMVASHVASGHWMGLPAQYCHSYLPKQGCTITLVDENGEEYQTKFIAEKTGLSAGWRKFSLDHKLVVGDALIFQLLEPTKLKVYIIRAYSYAEVDVALGLLDFNARAVESDPDKLCKTTKRTRKRRRSLPLCVIQGDNWNSCAQVPGPNLGVPTGNDSEEVDSEVVQGIEFSGPTVEFRDMGNLETFTIKVNDFVVDSELSDYVRAKYYELCCSRKAFLHEHLLKGINPQLVGGIISETVNIADAIRGSNLMTPRDDFATWDKSLIAFEQLGMNVGFLRSRLQQLVILAFESEEAMESKRFREATLGQDSIEVKIRATEVKLVKLKETSKRFVEDVKTLKVKAECHKMKFQAEANAPW